MHKQQWNLTKKESKTKKRGVIFYYEIVLLNVQEKLLGAVGLWFVLLLTVYSLWGKSFPSVMSILRIIYHLQSDLTLEIATAHAPLLASGMHWLWPNNSLHWRCHRARFRIWGKKLVDLKMKLRYKAWQPDSATIVCERRGVRASALLFRLNLFMAGRLTTSILCHFQPCRYYPSRKTPSSGLDESSNGLLLWVGVRENAPSRRRAILSRAPATQLRGDVNY